MYELSEVRDVTTNDNLQRALTAAIVQLDEEKVVSTRTSRPGPAGHRNQLVEVWFVVLMKGGDSDSVTIGEERYGFGFDDWVTDE